MENSFNLEKSVKTEGIHQCGYCGQPNFSPDPDVLCPDCRDDFGHAFYSEL